MTLSKLGRDNTSYRNRSADDEPYGDCLPEQQDGKHGRKDRLEIREEGDFPPLRHERGRSTRENTKTQM